MGSLRILVTALVVALVPATAASAAPAGTTLLLSAPLGAVGPLAGLVNDSGFGSSFSGAEARMISADGNKVVFWSSADAMDPTPDDDRTGGIYVRDLTTNTTTLVSRATGASGAAANGYEGSATISADGNRVAFLSSATNLDPADTDPALSIYVRDLTTNTTYLASRANGAAGASGNKDAWQPSLSNDGRYVAFATGSTNISGPSGTMSVYRRDLTTNATAVVSTLNDDTTRVDGNSPSISPDGARVAFVSNTAIDGLYDVNGGQRDVYLHTVGTTTITLVSRINGAGTSAGNGASTNPSIASPAGDKVAFISSATNLTAVSDTNNAQDAFVRDVNGNTTTLISRATGGGGAIADQGASEVSITRDGTGVAFTSSATNLGVAPPPNGASLTFMRSGTTTSLISSATGSTGDPADRPVGRPSTDDTGAAISFVTQATNLSTANDDDFGAVYVRRPGANTTTFASRPTGNADFIGGIAQSFPPNTGDMVSADGRYVLFASQSDALSGEDDNQYQNVFRYDVKTGERILVSRATGATGVPANGTTAGIGLSADGNRALFLGVNVSNLDPDAPSSGYVLYVRDIAAGSTSLAGRRPGLLGAALGDTLFGAFSGDGHHVAFVTSAGIDPADGNGSGDVYVRNLDTGADTLASRDNGADGAVANAFPQDLSLNADGNRVAWQTGATNLPGYDATKFSFTYVRDLSANTTTLIGRADGASGATVTSTEPRLSDDGNRAAFASQETGVTADGADARQHIYVRDLTAGTTVLASRADGATGAPDNPAPGATTFGDAHSLSGDGNRVMFESMDPALVSGDTNGSVDTFVRDIAAGRTIAVGRVNGVDGALGAMGSSSGGINANGQCAAFYAQGTGFVTDGVPGADFTQVYLRAIDGSCPPDVTPPAPTPTPITATDPVPVLSLFSLSAKTFRVGPKATAISAAKRKKLPVGTTLRYKASEPVTMTFTFARRLAGKRKGKSCVKPTKALRKRRSCTRLVSAGKLTRKSKTGSGSVKFSGRIGRKALKPGSYQVTAQATDSAKQKSKKRTVRFTVKR